MLLIVLLLLLLLGLWLLQLLMIFSGTVFFVVIDVVVAIETPVLLSDVAVMIYVLKWSTLETGIEQKFCFS